MWFWYNFSDAKINLQNLQNHWTLEVFRKNTFIFIFCCLKINFYRQRNIFTIWNRIYSDRSELDLSDETIKPSELNNFHFSQKWWWKTAEKYRNSYVAKKRIFSKLWNMSIPNYDSTVWKLDEDCVKISCLYFTRFLRICYKAFWSSREQNRSKTENFVENLKNIYISFPSLVIKINNSFPQTAWRTARTPTAACPPRATTPTPAWWRQSPWTCCWQNSRPPSPPPSTSASSLLGRIGIGMAFTIKIASWTGESLGYARLG